MFALNVVLSASIGNIPSALGWSVALVFLIHLKFIRENNKD